MKCPACKLLYEMHVWQIMQWPMMNQVCIARSVCIHILEYIGLKWCSSSGRTTSDCKKRERVD